MRLMHHFLHRSYLMAAVLPHLLPTGIPGEKAWTALFAQEVVPGQEAGSGEGGGRVVWVNILGAINLVKRYIKLNGYVL